jgi:putative addiction module killer protein
MIEIRRTEQFRQWLATLNAKSRARVFVRLDRLAMGNAGDARPVGGGVSELRIKHGPGFRVYFVRRGAELIIILGGGDKSTQAYDIKAARTMSEQLE